MHIDIDRLLDRHRDRFKRLVAAIVAEESGEDPFRVPYDRFEVATEDERALLVERADAIARGRIERELEERGAAWIILVGDEVVMASPDPLAIPSPDDVLALGRERGLVPYLFEAPRIEEIVPPDWSWAPLGGGDAYPTISMGIGRPATPFVGDLDTGSFVTLFDATIVQSRMPIWFRGRHLGESFSWCPVKAEITVCPDGAEPIQREMPLRAVRSWATSPFTKVNPARRALVGRDLLRHFGLAVALRAETAVTRVTSAR